MTRKLLVLLFPLLLIVFVPSVSALNATTESAQTTTTDPGTKLKQQMKLIQDQKKDTLTQVRNDAKALLQTKREEFKARVLTIKDQAKKALIERIDGRIAEVNKNQTDKFIDVLNKLQVFIDRANGTASDTAKLTDTTVAQNMINSARTAVTAQAEKSYTMMITDDAALKVNAGTTVSQFRHDLIAVHKLVQDAKQAVQKLFINKEIIRKDATSSAKL
jgi:hypothetical protein